MPLKFLALMPALLAVSLTLPASTQPLAPAPARSIPAATLALAQASYPPPHITVVDPVPAWPIWERISWAANLVLVLLGYGAIMLAVSLLKKIQRQTEYGEEAAKAAMESASAALLCAQSLVRAERPWIMISIEPSPDTENASSIVATNRGRSPARLVATTESLLTAADEEHLFPGIANAPSQPVPLPGPILLLPGESAVIRRFGLEEVHAFCAAEKQQQELRDWQQKLYLCGKVLYKDLIAPPDQQTHETAWCSWYVYGQKKKGLILIDAPTLTTHT